MDELDIGGIEEILKQAAKIRADIKTGLQCKKELPNNKREYKCNGCGEDNSWLSVWCFKCGLGKNAKPMESKPEQVCTLKSKFSVDCNVYNTDQLLGDLQPNQATKIIEKPREINSTRHSPMGELKVFKYDQENQNKKNSGLFAVNKKNIENNMENILKSTVSLDIESEYNNFSQNDIIIYDRGENKKSKKKLIIKPLSAPSQNGRFSPVKNAWDELLLSKQTKPQASNSLIKNSRPHSMTSISPQKAGPEQANSAYKRPNSACSRRTVSATPAVFERLYNNESKIKNRSVQRSPQLMSDKIKLLKTSTVSLTSAPHLHVQSNEKYVAEEYKVINNKPKAANKSFPKQICASPLTVSGIRTSLPTKTAIKLCYKVDDGVQWTNLPAEIWVQIMAYVSHKHLTELVLTCSYLYQISSDTSIWDKITVINKALSDSNLQAIGERNPKQLVFSGCNGEKLSTAGLRSLFRCCAKSLKELTVTDCKGGELVSSSLLLHVSARCQDLSSIHLSLCNIGDEALSQLAQRTNRLERVCIPMCSGIKDSSFRVLLQKHYRTLTCLDITGCYHISADAIAQLSLCPSLSSLYLGNCNQISSSTLRYLTLTTLTVLDIRGCKNVSSDSVVDLLASNPHIHTLSLAHVTMVTDAVLERVAQVLLSLQVLDLSGCIKVTSGGLQHLVKHPIEALDLGSTAVSFRGCCAIANYLSTTLQQVSFNFCSDVNDECVRKIVLKCKKLVRISIFGCSYVRNSVAFYKLNSNLVIDM